MRFAQRLADRDNPPPPQLPSQEPAAVAARLADWLLATYHLSHSRTRHQLSLMLLALMEAPECSSAQLGATCGLQQQATARRLGQLCTLGSLLGATGASCATTACYPPPKMPCCW